MAANDPKRTERTMQRSQMQIEDSDAPLDEAQIDALEQAFGSPLPLTYRGFLMRHNGGIPQPGVLVDVVGLPGSPTDVQLFFGIRTEVVSSDLHWNLRSIAHLPIKQRLLPIACDSGGSLFCLQDDGEGRISVSFLDAETAWTSLFEVARSFELFIGMLRT
jgi:hypothetical protein